MKRFRSVGSDRCSMLLTDFKADAKSCGNTAIFLGGFNCWRKKESTKSWSGQLWSAVLASSVVGFNDVNIYEHSFFPDTSPCLTWKHVSVFNQSVWIAHVLHQEMSCSPQMRLWDRFAKAYSTMFNDVRASTNAGLQIFLPAFWGSRGTTWTCHGYSWDEPHGIWGSLTALLLCNSLETIETIASLSCQCS